MRLRRALVPLALGDADLVAELPKPVTGPYREARATYGELPRAGRR